MDKDLKKLHLNFCNNSLDSLTDLILFIDDLELINLRKSEADKLEDFHFEQKSVAGYTAFIYRDAYDFEMSFIKRPDLNLHTISVSSFPVFEDYKEHIETVLKYDQSKDFVYLIKKLVTVKNSDGETLEEKLNPLLLMTYNHNLDLMQSIQTYRNGESFSKMKKIVEESFLEDKKAVSEMKEMMLNIQILNIEYNPEYEKQEKVLLEMLIDNELYGSLIVLDYLCKRLNQL